MPALSGQLLADFSSFTQACADAETSLKSFEDGSSKVSAQITRMSNSLSGVQIVQQATIAAEAVDRIGGVSVLTEAELAKVGATAQAAADKLIAMGQDVPPGIQAIADAAKGADEATTHWVATIAEGVLGGELLTNAFDSLLEGVKALAEALPELVEHTIAVGNAVFEMSLKSGASVEGLSALRYVASQTGVDFDRLGNTTLPMMEKNLGAVGPAATLVSTAITRLGLNMQTLKDEQSDQAFIDIATALEGIPNSADKANIAAALLGRGAKEMAGLWHESIGPMIQEAKDLGLIMSDQTVAASHAAEIGFKTLEQQIEAVGIQIGATVLPALVAFEQLASEAFQGLVAQYRTANAAVSQNELRDAVVKIGEALIAGVAAAAGFAAGAVAGLENVTKAAIRTGEAVVNVAYAMIKVGTLGTVDEAGQTFLDKTQAALHATYDALEGLKQPTTDAAAIAQAGFSAIEQAADGMAGRFGAAYDKAGATIADFAGKVHDGTDGVGQNIDLVAKKTDAYTRAMQDLAVVGTTWQDTLAAVNPGLVEDARQMLAAGASAKDLGVAWGLLPPVMKAIEDSIKDAAKTTTDTDTSIGRTAQIWDQYFTAVNKGAHDNLAVKLDADQQWYDKAIGLLDKSKDHNDNYYNELDAINATFEAKRATDTTDALQKIEAADSTSTTNRIANLNELQALGTVVAEQYFTDWSKALTKTETLQNEFNANTITLSGKTADTQVAAVDKWFNDSVAKLDRLAPEYQTQYDLIVAIAGQRYAILQKQSDDAAANTSNWATALRDVGGVLGTIGGVAGGAFGQVITDIGKVVTASGALEKAMGALSTATSGGQGFNAADLTAVAAGWVGVAVAVYEVVASIMAANAAAQAADAQLAFAQELSREWSAVGGTVDQFSASLTQAIKATQDGFDAAGNTFAATYADAFHLADIITELGGTANLTATQLVTVGQNITDLFKVIAVGGTPAVQALDALDKAATEIGKDSIAATGLVDQQFLDIVKQATAAGVALSGVNALILAQSQSAATGLDAILAGLQGSSTAAAQKPFQDQIAALEALKTAAEAAGKSTTDLDRQIAALTTQMNATSGAVNLTQTEFDGLSAATVADFATMLQQGVSFTDALKAIQPSITGLQAAMASTGVTGGAAFTELSNMSLIANNAIEGPLANAIVGVNTSLQGLHNAGVLNQSMFAGLGETALDALNQIKAQGGDSTAALAIMQPTLQTMWELEQQFGLKADDATQALIDQQVAAGNIGENFKSPAQQMLDATLGIEKAVQDLAAVFTTTIPNSAQTAAAAIKQQLGSITIPTVHVNYVLDAANSSTVVQGSPSPASVTSLANLFTSSSAVSVPSVLTANALSTTTQARSGWSTGGSGGTLIVPIQVNGREITRAIVPLIPDELRRLGII